MVFISDKKYACETCIKGHRSSSCKHTDRPLFEIKKKGRPVTQCEHCRELRKTKQVHVKCICESKGEILTGPPAPKRGGTKIPESATFPNGLPDALEASVALQLAEGASSDSDHGGIHNSCSCAYGGDCHCCTPRKSIPRTKKKADGQQSAATNPNASNLPPHVIARVSELRTVLPRPPNYIDGPDVPSHDPSLGVTHGHPARHHDSLLYSPYGRAYGLNHLNSMSPQARASDGPLSDMSKAQPSFFDMLQLQQHLSRTQAPAASNSWGTAFDPSSFLSACDCGDGCRCPGCIFHHAAGALPSPSALSACANPSSCTSCLDCFLRIIPSSPSPPDTALSIYSSPEVDAVGEWMRQIPNATSQAPDPELFSSTSVDDQQRYSSPDSWTTNSNPSDYGVRGGYTQNVGMYTGAGNQNGYPSERQQLYGRSDIFNRTSPSPSAVGVSWQTPRPSEFSRSRSPSTSSQSSHEHLPSEAVGHPYMPMGRVQGFFTNASGARSLPQLLTTNGLHKFTASRSPPSTSPGIAGPTYAVSNPDSESSLEEFSSSSSHYDPCFEALNIR